MSFLSSLSRRAFARTALLGFAALGASFTASAADTGFQSLFNGKDLTGWEGNMDVWSVRDGAITGQTTAEKGITANTFLIWKGGEPKNFELRVSFRLQANNDRNSANSGVQFRSKVLDAAKFVVGGYQTDMDYSGRYIGMLYEEKGRGIIMKPGEKIRVLKGLDGKHKVEPDGHPTAPETVRAAYKVGEWNDLVIIANGPRIQQFLNGTQTADVTDLDDERAAKSGVIALQLHTGPPMTIQFKNIQLKQLP